MTLSDLAALGSFISGIAVIVSLVFLYFQLRQLAAQNLQSQRNQQAAIQQAANHLSINIWMSRALNPSIREASRASVTHPQEMTLEQWEQVLILHVAMIRLYQDDFRHHNQGLLSDAAFASRTTAFRSSMSYPQDRATWSSVKNAYDFWR